MRKVQAFPPKPLNERQWFIGGSLDLSSSFKGYRGCGFDCSPFFRSGSQNDLTLSVILLSYKSYSVEMQAIKTSFKREK